ncbi:MAG: M14 family zinc carboxypeptidase, partial [Bacteroidales bacterium]
MKRITIIIQLIAVSLILGGQTPLSYYLPENVNYNPAIPVPADIIGHEVGEWHATHDNLILYMKELARISDRAIWEEYGRSHEQRVLGDLIISSPENIKNIESIRQRHLMLRDPAQSPSLDIENMPVIIKLGYGVHGNESSAQNASLVAAYHFVAGMGSDIDNLLANTVILIDPNLNPDGYHRHSAWVN